MVVMGYDILSSLPRVAVTDPVENVIHFQLFSTSFVRSSNAKKRKGDKKKKVFSRFFFTKTGKDHLIIVKIGPTYSPHKPRFQIKFQANRIKKG